MNPESGQQLDSSLLKLSNSCNSVNLPNLIGNTYSATYKWDFQHVQSYYLYSVIHFFFFSLKTSINRTLCNTEWNLFQSFCLLLSNIIIFSKTLLFNISCQFAKANHSGDDCTNLYWADNLHSNSFKRGFYSDTELDVITISAPNFLIFKQTMVVFPLLFSQSNKITESFLLRSFFHPFSYCFVNDVDLGLKGVI